MLPTDAAVKAQCSIKVARGGRWVPCPNEAHHTITPSAETVAAWGGASPVHLCDEHDTFYGARYRARKGGAR